MRIANTLSLLLVSAVLVAVASMAGVISLSLRNGFADYMAESDIERLERFAVFVQDDAKRRSLTTITSQDYSIHDLLLRFAVTEGVADPSGTALPGRPPERQAATDGPPPSDHAPPPGARETFGARVLIATATGAPLLGELPYSSKLPTIDRPIILDGKLAAIARMRVAEPVPDPVQTRFLRSQYYAISAVSILLIASSLTGALWVGRRWAGPLLAVQSATARMANGEFGIQLSEDTSVFARRNEISELVRNVNQMSSSLQRLETARRRWLAEISHELRTPLSALRGETEALVDGVRGLDAAAIRSLHEEVLHLSALVDDLHLLATSELQGLHCNFSGCNAGDLIEDALARFLGSAKSKNIQLGYEPECTAPLGVHWDSIRIGQLLNNLLENAIRYTDAPGKVVVSLRCVDGKAFIAIDDSAPGLSPEELEKVFEPLYRAEAARSRHTGGSGLGLAICEAIARSHGGSIRAMPSVLGGVRLLVDLPRFPVDTGGRS
jgi:two-component system, OmpR family, sensor histidine kinase BaeS